MTLDRPNTMLLLDYNILTFGYIRFLITVELCSTKYQNNEFT